jgi:hypothetical protein
MPGMSSVEKKEMDNEIKKASRRPAEFVRAEEDAHAASPTAQHEIKKAILSQAKLMQPEEAARAAP